MTTDENLFNVDPYYDDYSDSKKFLKVLFRPGYAVQGRELTQSQTILNKQIKRFGDNIFKDGSIVSESQVVLNSAQFIRVSGLTGYAGVSVADFDGLTATVNGKNTVRVVDTISGLTSSNVEINHSILVFSEYLQGATGFALGDTIRAVYSGVAISGTITGGTATYNYYGGAPSSLPAFGDASLIGIDNGVRYIKGYFVNHDRQKLTAYNVTGSGSNTYRIFNNLNSSLYLAVTDSIITSLDDSTLTDPAYGSYNYAAPGADRYRIDLTLSQASLTSASPYVLMNIENGDVTYKSNFTEYNVLADTLARRTYDESGNYTVDDFPISVDDHATDETKLSVKIGKGKAYIFGQEFVNFANKTLTLDKPRTTKTLLAQDIPTVLGNEVSLRFSPSLTASIVNTIDFNASPLFYISSGTTGAFSRVGTARVGRYNAIDGGTKANLYDFILDSGYTSGSARRLFYPGYTGSDQHVFDFTTTPFEITKTNYNSLLFPLSQDINSYAVSNVSSQEFKVQRSYNLYLTGVNQNITTQNFSPDWAASTYQEFNSINDLKIYSPTGAAISYTAMFGGDTRTISLTAGSSGITATVFASIKINSAGTDFRRNKTLASIGPTSVTMKTSSFEEYAYLNGAVDAYSILNITGQISGATSNMTTYFNLDTGQKDDIYDWSRIVLKPQYMGLGATAISVSFTKFNRSSSPSNGCGPFFANSYTSVGITGTPIYTFRGRNGKTVSLGGCYDFRPDRISPTSLSGNDAPELYGATGVAQLNDVNLTVAWAAYLPRTDKIVLSKDKQFSVIEGVDSEQALAPEDSPDAMTLANVFMSPYTKSATDTKKYIVKNRRYTMKDIGKIDKRVDRLEYYTTLSLQEKDAKTLQIQDANGLNKFKNGIFVDDFTSRTNSSYNSSDHSCSVDPEKKEIRPRFTTKYIDFGLTGTVPSSLTANSDGIVMLNYTEEVFLDQSLASKSVNVNPFNVVNFNGTLTLTPESDDWVDTTTRPSVLVNLSGENDGIGDTDVVDFGTVWNNWETNWTGRTVGSTPWNFIDNSPSQSFLNQSGTWIPASGNSVLVTAQQSTRTVTGQRILVSPETVTRNIGDRIVDVSIIPFMRAATITIAAQGMRPNVTVYPFFDGTNVSAYCTGTLTTNSEGSIGPIVFSLPAGIFRTGERIFRLIDVSTNIVADCSTCAEKVYRAQGLLKTEESTIVSTRNLVIRREAVTEERVFNSITTREIASGGSYSDPTAQTFLIDPITYPSGMFVSSVDLFFKTKSTTLPVSLQIRPTANGYPSSWSIVPFSEIHKSAADVAVSDDGTTATNFKFSTPIFLQPGEYAIVALSNSDEYELWVSEVGQPDIVSGELITSQPYPGSFFKSQNSSTWTAEQAIDLKFKINKCLFDISGGAASFAFDETNYVTGVTGIASFSNGANIFKINSTYIEPANTGVSTTIQFETGGILNTAVPILNNQNYTFSAKQPIIDSNTNTVKTNFALSSTVTDVSPVLDSQRVSGLYIQNLVNRFNTDSYKDLYETYPSVRGITDSTNLGITRYLSRKINLQEGFESNSVDVYLTARIPLNSDIRAYIKSQSPSDNTTFENLPYEPLQIHTDYAIPYGSATGSSRYVSVGEDDYVDLRFTRGGTGVTRTSGTTGQTEFKSFQVKVVLYGDATNSVVPAFKDFRVIAT